MFVSIGGDGKSWKLGDIKMTCNGSDGGSYGSSIIQFLDPTTSKIDANNVYTYYGIEDGADDTDAGWYNVNDDETLCNDMSFPAGTAFLCNFNATKAISLTFAGEVLVGDITIDTTDDGVQIPYMFIVNPLPVDSTLGDIQMLVNENDGGAYGSSIIQFVDPATSKVDVDKIFTYYGVADGAEADEIGWYNSNDEDTLCNTFPLAIGEGFLCSFNSTKLHKLVFKSALAK